MAKLFNFRTFAVVFFLSGIYALVFSDSGLLERMNLHKKKVGLERRLQGLKSENEELIARYEFYKKGGLTREDLVKAGYVRSGEKLVFFHGLENEDKKISRVKPAPEKEAVPLKHLRIIWIAVSALVLIFYFSRYAGEDKDEK